MDKLRPDLRRRLRKYMKPSSQFDRLGDIQQAFLRLKMDEMTEGIGDYEFVVDFRVQMFK